MNMTDIQMTPLAKTGTAMDSLGAGSIVDQVRAKPKDTMALRHTVVMALSASIGTGLWIASASALRYGGPLGVIFAFLIVGLMLYVLMSNVNEMLTLKPNENGMFGYIQDFCGDALAFTTVCNYSLLWLFCFPAELVAATSLIKRFGADGVPDAVWISLIMAVSILTMILPPRWYGESEFLLGCIKIVALLTCWILIICIDAGRFSSYIPQQDLIWSSDSLFGQGGRGPLLAFLSAGFAMGGLELFSLSVLETQDPRASARRNIHAIILRLAFCYMLTILMFTTVIASDATELHRTTSAIFAALTKAQQPILEKTMIAFVLVTLLSAANTALYLISRTMARMAQMGFVPKRLEGSFTSSPCWPAVGISLCFGCIAYMTCTRSGAQAFDYLIGIVAMGNYLTWTGLALSHIRFRYGLRKFQKTNARFADAMSLITYRTMGPWWLRDMFVLMVIAVAFIAQFWLAINPLVGSFSGIGFISATGIIFIFIIVLCARMAYNRYRKVSNSPRDVQEVLMEYFEAHIAYRCQ